MTDPTDDRRRGSATDRRSGRDPADRRAAAGDDRDPRDESTQIAAEERRRDGAFVSAVVAAIGLWVAVSPFVYDAAAATLWNNALVGAVIALAGAYNYYRIANDVPLSGGVAALAALLGIWLVVAPALLGMASGPFWSTIASGLLVALLAGYDAYESREARTVAPDSRPGAR